MEAMELSNKMRDEARALGLCDEWYNAWGNASVQDMLDKLKRGFDFCLQHHWPDAGFIKDNVGVDLLRENKILANDKWSMVNPKECFLLGRSESYLRYNGKGLYTAWVTGESRAQLTAKGKSTVVVELCDEAQVFVHLVHPEARVVVVTHGDRCSCVTDEGVMVVMKEGKEYDK